MGKVLEWATSHASDIAEPITGAKGAAASSRYAADLAYKGEAEKLAFLKEQAKIPNELRDVSLQGLGSEYGLVMGPDGQMVSDGTGIAERAMSSPLYAGLMEGGLRGEDAIMRNASMTGGLRSGNTSANLWDYNAKLQNNAMLASYQDQIQGVKGLAGLDTNTNAIGRSMGNLGGILGQGEAAAGQATAQGKGQMMELGAAALIAMFSDPKLKTNKKKAGKRYGYDWFTWDWNDTAKSMFGLEGSSEGVMADLVKKVRPDLVTEQDGYMIVNYTGIMEGAA